MIENPAQPVSFVIYKTSERAESNMIDRRMLYVQNRNRLPLAVWCRWIVESNCLPCLNFVLIFVEFSYDRTTILLSSYEKLGTPTQVIIQLIGY